MPSGKQWLCCLQKYALLHTFRFLFFKGKSQRSPVFPEILGWFKHQLQKQVVSPTKFKTLTYEFPAAYLEQMVQLNYTRSFIFKAFHSPLMSWFCSTQNCPTCLTPVAIIWHIKNCAISWPWRFRIRTLIQFQVTQYPEMLLRQNWSFSKILRSITNNNTQSRIPNRSPSSCSKRTRCPDNQHKNSRLEALHRPFDKVVHVQQFTSKCRSPYNANFVHNLTEHQHTYYMMFRLQLTYNHSEFTSYNSIINADNG